MPKFCDLLIVNAAQILTLQGEDLGIIEDGAVAIQGENLISVGPTPEVLARFKGERYDARGCLVMPGWVDPHTHLVFAGFRDEEFERRMSGEGYEAIARAGGGILSTVLATRQASEDELFELSQKRLKKLLSWGTTTVEVKSGYGLSREAELKLLRVIRRLKEVSPLTIVPTFLGAHLFPPEQSREAYTVELCEELIPEVARSGLAEYCDVFCDRIAFNRQESEKVLLAARAEGLGLKIHADELAESGGAELAGELGASSADHLIHPTDKGLELMRRAGTVAVLLPSSSLFLRSESRPPVSKMHKLGLTLALGSDYNPGSSMCYQMPLIVGLGCMLYGLTLAEAIRAATINGAKALGLLKVTGSLEPGKWADLQVLGIPNYRWIGYGFGEHFTRLVMKKGKIIYAQDR